MTTEHLTDKQRWTALYVLCTGMLMIVLDITVVNVALPSIQTDLGFTSSDLAWVVHGYLLVPVEPSLVQSGKARSGPGEQAAQAGIAGHVIDHVLDEHLCLIGPGTTTRTIMKGLGLEKTVLGVDVVRGRELVAADADEARLLQLTDGADARIVVTPVGGQGFVFGRGNQQLSARVITQVGCSNVTIVATDTKLAALGGRPLLVDTGDRDGYPRPSGFPRSKNTWHRARGGSRACGIFLVPADQRCTQIDRLCVARLVAPHHP